MRKFLNRLRSDKRGATMIEFAFVAPPMLMLMIGAFDLSYEVYARSVLQGALEKAARDSSLQSATVTTEALDARVTQLISHVVTIGGNNSVVFVRRSYVNLSDVGDMEDFTDSDDDGKCDLSEPFEDVNGNSSWDDKGTFGLGGARAAVLYTATLHFKRIFPAHSMLGLKEYVDLKAVSVLRNQPYDEKSLVVRPVKKICVSQDL
jgi:Flp pilus assembly pilin Flp